mgnify:CR=1 FL=1
MRPPTRSCAPTSSRSRRCRTRRGRGRLTVPLYCVHHRLHRAPVLGVPARRSLLRRQRAGRRRAVRARRATRAHRGHRHPDRPAVRPADRPRRGAHALRARSRSSDGAGDGRWQRRRPARRACAERLAAGPARPQRRGRVRHQPRAARARSIGCRRRRAGRSARSASRPRSTRCWRRCDVVGEQGRRAHVLRRRWSRRRRS